MNKATAIFSIIAATLFIMLYASGCSDTRFSRFANIPDEGWVYGDTVRIMINDPEAKPGQMSVAIRHNDRFLYRNLWLEISYTDRNGICHTDSVNIELADIYGRWLGHGLGSSYQLAVPFPGLVNPPDSAIVNIRHIMRVDTIRGIEQVGLSVADSRL